MIVIASFFHFAIVCVRPDREIETKQVKNEEEIKRKNKLDV
jgi:hypothetical protein